MNCVHDFQDQQKDKTSNKGDLEMDYLQFLAKVQKAAQDNPVDVELDFV